MVSKREQLQKEMSKEKTKIDKGSGNSNVFIYGSVIAVLILVVVVAGVAIFNSARNSEGNPNAVGKNPLVVPNMITVEESVKIDADGAADPNPDESDPEKLRIQVFFDPLCPACGMVDRALGGVLLDKVKSGEAELYLNPVPFLDNASTDNYSTRASSAFMTVVENSPEHAYAFITEMFKMENQPSEATAYVPVPNEKLAEWAKNAGVPEDKANKITEDIYSTWMLEHSQRMTERSIFKDGFSTPTILLGGKVVDGEIEGSKKVEFTPNEDILATFDRFYEEARNS